MDSTYNGHSSGNSGGKVGVIMRHDWGYESRLADTVLAALEEMPSIDLENGPPLQEFMDLDALSELFNPAARDATGCRGFVAFHYENHEVRITNDGLVSIQQNRGYQ